MEWHQPFSSWLIASLVLLLTDSLCKDLKQPVNKKVVYLKKNIVCLPEKIKTPPSATDAMSLNTETQTGKAREGVAQSESARV